MSDLNANPESGAESVIKDPVEAFAARMTFKGEPQGEQAQAEQESEAEAIEPEVDDQSSEDEAEPEQTYKVKVNGQEIEVPLSELLNGYSRQADYTNKTKAVSEQRQQVEAERQSVLQQRNQASQMLNNAQAVLEAQLNQLASQADLDYLLQNDPAAYLQVKHQQEQAVQKLQGVYQQQQYLRQLEAQEQELTMQHVIAQEQELLLAAVPDWKDDAKRTAEYGEIKNWLKSSGFNDSDIAGITDHRAVIAARKAMLYDQMIAKANAANKKVQNVPPKMERPGVSISGTDGRTKQMQALAKSGKTEDAAAIFERLL